MERKLYEVVRILKRWGNGSSLSSIGSVMIAPIPKSTNCFGYNYVEIRYDVIFDS